MRSTSASETVFALCALTARTTASHVALPAARSSAEDSSAMNLSAGKAAASEPRMRVCTMKSAAVTGDTPPSVVLSGFRCADLAVAMPRCWDSAAREASRTMGRATARSWA